ncbi:MAG: hypothetical protein R3F54_05315 [Alphaproteobacteria bacterium]
MLDKILALISIASFIGFISILIYYVTEPDLTIICIIVLVMAAFDFFLLTRNKPKTDSQPKG